MEWTDVKKISSIPIKSKVASYGNQANKKHNGI